MGFFKKLYKWRDRRNELAHLRAELDEVIDLFRRSTRELKPNSQKHEEALALYNNQSEVLAAHIRKIETEQTIESSRRYPIDIPPFPILPATANEHWRWNPVLGGYHLTTKGIREIKHAVALEQELRYRPWLSWGAIAISFAALVVSIFRP